MVHCAVRNDDQSSPAEAFLSALETDSLPDDPAQVAYADEQPAVFAWFLDRIQYFAERGVPKNINGDVNYLTDGIWEFKRGNKRITFYDTDGSGDFTPKPRNEDYASAPVKDESWRIPDFDDFIRLGHSFLKTTQETPQEDLDNAYGVRREDLRND